MSAGSLDPTLAAYVREASQIIGEDYPGIGVTITSWYRSPEKQALLRARWDQGDRVGLLVRPALFSSHTRGRAVDLAFTVGGIQVPVAATPLAAFEYLAAVLEPLVWGGTFRVPDVAHFELP